MHQDVVSVVAAILLAGVIAQWLGWRLRVPAIVFLLAAGLIAGPLTGTLDPDATFGRLLFPAVSIAVAVILFEGALGLGARGIRAAGTTVWVLLSVGAVVTLVGTMIAARLILDVEWRFAALLASVLVVTGPTVIGPIIRSLGLHDRVGAILEAEGT
ncbi:MAG: cation:proton antiporter, partial [Acidimicrobiia bacterium]|nr:cation:proton antiporter [Acidimicrobiia bacterium]